MRQIASGPAIGGEIGGYRIDSLLGQGGMGAVYVATHVRLGRRAAIKLLLPGYAADEDFRERFIRESQAAASLDHPNIVPVYDADEEQGVLYIAMRYVEGEDLGSLLEREGRLAPERALAVIEQAASALDAAHASGLVHRDVKPANILLGAPGEHVYLTDFGVAKHATAPGLTRTGSFIGTVDYSAPEQIEGKDVDGRTDVYALGCVLFECLTGRPPFAKESEVAVLHAHLLEAPATVSSLRPDLTEALDEVIARALAKRPEDRYATCTALAQALRQALDGRPSPAAATVPSPPAKTPAPPAPETEPSVTREARAATVEPAVPPTRQRVEPSRELPVPGRRLRVKYLAVVGIAALTGAAGIYAAFLLTGGKGPDGTTTRTPPTTKTPIPNPIPASERPGLAVAGGSAFLSSPRGHVLRLASTSLAVQGSVPNGAHPHATVVMGENLVVADNKTLTWLRASDFVPLAAVEFGPDPMLAAAAGAPVAAARPLSDKKGRVCVVRQRALGPCAALAFEPSGLGVASGGRIFVANAEKEALIPFGLRAGRLVPGKRLDLPGGPRANLVEFRGRLYVPVADGVAVVDLGSGKLRRTISLGATPSAISIAPSSGRLFVALPGLRRVAVVDVTLPSAKPRTIKVGKLPAALGSGTVAGVGDVVFLLNVGSRTVARLDPFDGHLLRSKYLGRLAGRPLGALRATGISLERVGRTTTVTIELAGGTLPKENLRLRDTEIGDRRAIVQLWQGGITTKPTDEDFEKLAIRIREAASRLEVTVTAKVEFESFDAHVGANRRSVVLVLTEPPPPVPTPKEPTPGITAPTVPTPTPG